MRKRSSLIAGIVVGGMVAAATADARTVQVRTHVKIGSCAWRQIGSGSASGSWPSTDNRAHDNAYTAASNAIFSGYPGYSCSGKTSKLHHYVTIRRQVKIDSCAWSNMGHDQEFGTYSQADHDAHIDATHEVDWHVDRRYPNYSCPAK